MKKENGDEIVGDGYDLTKNKTKTDDAFNRIKEDNRTLLKNEMVTSSKFRHEPSASVSMRNIQHVIDMPKKALQQIQTSMKSLENIKMKDSSTNRIKR
jgi:hypothetical protein